MRQGTAEEGNWFKGEDGVPPFCGGKEKTRILLVHFELPFFSNPFFFTASAFSSILLLIVLREEIEWRPFEVIRNWLGMMKRF